LFVFIILAHNFSCYLEFGLSTHEKRSYMRKVSEINVRREQEWDTILKVKQWGSVAVWQWGSEALRQSGSQVRWYWLSYFNHPYGYWTFQMLICQVILGSQYDLTYQHLKCPIAIRMIKIWQPIPSHLTAWLPQCLTASLPHCHTASLLHFQYSVSLLFSPDINFTHFSHVTSLLMCW
jgi:hypothetical protein